MSYLPSCTTPYPSCALQGALVNDVFATQHRQQRQIQLTVFMLSVIHNSKPWVASLRSQVTDAGFAMPDAGLQMEAMTEEYEEEEDSPYAEVRASVSNTDDLDMPVLTFRMWVIGIFLTIGSAAINTFFNFRNPQIYIISLPVLCVQRASLAATHPCERETLTGFSSFRLVAYPLGRLAAAVLPIRHYDLPKFLGGYRFSLNPGQ